MSKQKDVYLEHYKQLQGLVVYDIVEDHINGEAVYGLVLKGLPSRGWPSNKVRTAWIFRDEEGNGPGFLDIQDVNLKK